MTIPAPLILDDASVKIATDGTDRDADRACLRHEPRRADARRHADDARHDVRLGRLPGQRQVVADRDDLPELRPRRDRRDALGGSRLRRARSRSRSSATSRSPSAPTTPSGPAWSSRSRTPRSVATRATRARSKSSGRSSASRPRVPWYPAVSGDGRRRIGRLRLDDARRAAPARAASAASRRRARRPS